MTHSYAQTSLLLWFWCQKPPRVLVLCMVQFSEIATAHASEWPVHPLQDLCCPLKSLGKNRAWLSQESNSPSLLRAACAVELMLGQCFQPFQWRLSQSSSAKISDTREKKISEKSNFLWFQNYFSCTLFPSYCTSDQWLHFFSDKYPYKPYFLNCK